MFVVCSANFDEIWWRLPDFNAIEFDQFDSVFYKAQRSLPNIFNYAFSLNVKQKHKIYAHYFVIVKLVSTSVSNNSNQDPFPLRIHLARLPSLLFAQPLYLFARDEKSRRSFGCCGYFAHFSRCCCCILFCSISVKTFFLCLEIFSI